MGNTIDLFKKTGDTKGTLHAKMGTIQDRNGKDLTEAEEIKQRWQEYIEELYEKDPNDPENHGDGVVTHLEQSKYSEWSFKKHNGKTIIDSFQIVISLVITTCWVGWDKTPREDSSLLIYLLV